MKGAPVTPTTAFLANAQASIWGSIRTHLKPMSQSGLATRKEGELTFMGFHFELLKGSLSKDCCRQNEKLGLGLLTSF